MGKELMNDLNILENSLISIFAVLSEIVPEIKLEFSPPKTFAGKNGQNISQYETVRSAAIVIESEGTRGLRIDRNLTEGGFRIGIITSPEERFENCSHKLFVPQGTEGTPDKWLIDANAISRTPQGKLFVKSVEGFSNIQQMYAKVNGVGSLFFHAVAPLIKENFVRMLIRQFSMPNARNMDENFVRSQRTKTLDQIISDPT